MTIDELKAQGTMIGVVLADKSMGYIKTIKPDREKFV